MDLPLAWNNVCIYSRGKIAKADLERGLLSQQIRPREAHFPNPLHHTELCQPLSDWRKACETWVRMPTYWPWSLPDVENNLFVFFVLFFFSVKKKRKICTMSRSSWHSSLAEQFISKHAWWFFFCTVMKQASSRTPGCYSSTSMSPTCMSLSLLFIHAFKH